MTANTLLEARGITVSRRGTVVLQDVSLSINAGEVLMLVGPNGAGKTSLLAALAGDVALVDGFITLDGAPLHTVSPKKAAQFRAVLPQQHTVGFSFTAREVVEMGRSPWLRTPREIDDATAVAEAMKLCDVKRFADRAFTALSGGERARVALARVLAQDTPVLLLDEPTAALDLRHQEEVMCIAREKADAGCAVVVVMHDLGLAAAYGDRAVILSEGRVHSVGPTRAVITSAALSEVYGLPVNVVNFPGTTHPVVVPIRHGKLTVSERRN